MALEEMEERRARWYSVMGSPVRRSLTGVWCVLVVAFDFLLAQQFVPFADSSIDGWATVVLTTETVGPMLAILLFHAFTVLAVLFVPELASSPLVRVALMVSVLNAAALSVMTAVASNGASAIVLTCAALGIGALRSTAMLWTRCGPQHNTVNNLGLATGGVVVVLAVYLSSALPLLIVGAGTAVSGLLVAIMLRETADDRAELAGRSLPTVRGNRAPASG